METIAKPPLLPLLDAMETISKLKEAIVQYEVEGEERVAQLQSNLSRVTEVRVKEVV